MSWTEAFGAGWNRFWFTPADPYPCSVLRVAVGLLAAVHFLVLGVDLARWYGADGLLPPAQVATLLSAFGEEPGYRPSYLGLLRSPGELWAAHGAAIVAALAFAAGCFTRVSGAATLVCLLAYVHRVPMVAGHAEPVLAFLVAYLTLAPSGACLSVDQCLRARRRAGAGSPVPAADDRAPSVAANIGLRLIQVHVAMFYAMMGLTKLYGDAWWQGEAIWILLAQTQSRPLDLTFLQRAGKFGEYAINLWTHGVVYFELALPVLVWYGWARRLLVALAAVVWLSIIAATGLVVFGLTMIVATAAFWPLSSRTAPDRA